MKRVRVGWGLVSVLIALSLIPLSGITLRPEGTVSTVSDVASPVVLQQNPPFLISNYSVPTANSVPDGIVVGLNHKLWFTEYGVGKIGEFDSVIKNFTEYTIPNAGATPATLAFYGPDQVWFTDQNPNSPSVWMFNTTSHGFRRFLTNATNSGPVFVLADQATKSICLRIRLQPIWARSILPPCR